MLSRMLQSAGDTKLAVDVSSNPCLDFYGYACNDWTGNHGNYGDGYLDARNRQRRYNDGSEVNHDYVIKQMKGYRHKHVSRNI